MANIRKSMPENLHFILPAFVRGTVGGVDGERTPVATEEKLLQEIMKGRPKSKALAIIELRKLIFDRMLKEATDCNGKAEYQSLPRNHRQGQRLLRMPLHAEIEIPNHDYYCFECCTPGQLEHCRQCKRSFHRGCYRKNPDRPNYDVPVPKNHRNQIPAFGIDSEEEPVGSDTSIDYDARPSCSKKLFLPPDQRSDGKTKATPMHQRATTSKGMISCKRELSNIEKDELCTQLCTCCRLLERANRPLPPNMQPDELCHLIGNSFHRNRSWLKTDVAMYVKKKKFPTNLIASVYQLLFSRSTISLESILQKQREQRYNLLSEFLVDILDLQYNIGVFFGNNSDQYESTKYFVRDLTYDIAEIRRCPDCFRYSHERDLPCWFAKPCVQRHELVFAKHGSSPYWPAKVIRMLSNKRHDVRFFGGSHSRALIEDRMIKPIDDFDFESQKLSKSSSFRKAMNELNYHMALSKYSPSKFGFHANKAEMERIINRVTSTALEGTVALNVGRKRKVVLVPLNDEPTAKLRPRRQSIATARTTVAPKQMPKRRQTNAFGPLIAQTQAEEPLFLGASTSGYQTSSRNRETETGTARTTVAPKQMPKRRQTNAFEPLIAQTQAEEPLFLGASTSGYQTSSRNREAETGTARTTVAPKQMPKRRQTNAFEPLIAQTQAEEPLFLGASTSGYQTSSRNRETETGTARTTVAPKQMPKRRQTNAFGPLIAQTQAEEPLFLGASTSGYQTSSRNREAETGTARTNVAPKQMPKRRQTNAFEPLIAQTQAEEPLFLGASTSGYQTSSRNRETETGTARTTVAPKQMPKRRQTNAFEPLIAQTQAEEPLFLGASTSGYQTSSRNREAETGTARTTVAPKQMPKRRQTNAFEPLIAQTQAEEPLFLGASTSGYQTSSRNRETGTARTTVAPKQMPKRRQTNAFGPLIAQTQAEEPLFLGASTSGYQTSSRNRETGNVEHNPTKRVTRSATRIARLGT